LRDHQEHLVRKREYWWRHIVCLSLALLLLLLLVGDVIGTDQVELEFPKDAVGDKVRKDVVRPAFELRSLLSPRLEGLVSVTYKSFGVAGSVLRLVGGVVEDEKWVRSVTNIYVPF
jgi:hypothetical protein